MSGPGVRPACCRSQPSTAKSLMEKQASSLNISSKICRMRRNCSISSGVPVPLLPISPSCSCSNCSNRSLPSLPSRRRSSFLSGSKGVICRLISSVTCWRRAEGAFNRNNIVSASSALVFAWPLKCPLPFSSRVKEAGFPMSCSSAAQRRPRFLGTASTTCAIWVNTS